MRTFAIALLALLVVAPSARAGVVTHTYTTATSFTVPAGTSFKVEAVGGQGQPGNSISPFAQSAGGAGGDVSGTLTIPEVATVHIDFADGAAGGLSGTPSGGGTGGGLASVAVGLTPVVVAGGGGGGGGAGPGPQAPGNGGAAGQAGTDGDMGLDSYGGHGGGAGSASAGGSGGLGGAYNGARSPSGAAGTHLAGGAGGGGSVGAPYAGGGGGAGWWGGGGGGGAALPGDSAGGGGGGGSSYAGPLTTSVISRTRANATPSVTISYDDETAPVVSLDAPAANPVSLTGGAGAAFGDDANVKLAFYSGTTATGTAAQTTTAKVFADTATFAAAVPKLADGTWTVVATQGDAGGNVGTSAPRTFVVDTTAPAVTLSVPRYVTTHVPQFTGTAGAAPGDQPTVAIVVPQAPGLQSQFVQISAGTFSSPWLGTALPDGDYTAYALQSDAYGHTGYSPTLAFTVDTAAPAPTLAAPPALSGASSVTLTGTGGTARGDDGSVRLDVTSGAALVRSVAAPLTAGAYTQVLAGLADGLYAVTATQDDAAGHTTTTAARGFRVDTTAPEIDTSAIAPSYAVGEVAAASFSCSDAGGSGVARCDGPASVDTGTAGDHELAITATDAAGNTRTATVRYTVLAPVVAAAPTPTPAPPATPAPVIVAAKPAPATLSLTTAKASRHGRTVTLTLRGKASGTGAIRIAAAGHIATAKPTKGAWSATLRIHVSAKHVTVTVSDAAHHAATVTRSVRV